MVEVALGGGCCRCLSGRGFVLASWLGAAQCRRKNSAGGLSYIRAGKRETGEIHKPGCYFYPTLSGQAESICCYGAAGAHTPPNHESSARDTEPRAPRASPGRSAASCESRNPRSGEGSLQTVRSRATGTPCRSYGAGRYVPTKATDKPCQNPATSIHAVRRRKKPLAPGWSAAQ